jgi:hypothetical protein
MPQICTAAYNFTRALLSYAAEESASWEHCWSQSRFRKTVLPYPNKGILEYFVFLIGQVGFWDVCSLILSVSFLSCQLTAAFFFNF